MALLSVNNLTAVFSLRTGTVRAVTDASFTVESGEIVGIVGESGCGKSAMVQSLLRLLPMPPARIENGEALFEGIDLLHCDNEHLRQIRGNRISMVFQDPLSSLNPYMHIIDQLVEPLRVHQGLSKREAQSKAGRAMKEVGLDNAALLTKAYPHAFSGGMRQRIMMAMALITRPALLIADEPTTALDVTVQAQVLELLRSLRLSHGMAVLFITHNLGVVARLCDRVLVMYAGRILESAPVGDLFHNTKHPYTKALIGSLPCAHRAGETLAVIAGQPPNLSENIRGCPFAPRCEYANEKCAEASMELVEISPGHSTACVRMQRGEI